MRTGRSCQAARKRFSGGRLKISVIRKGRIYGCRTFFVGLKRKVPVQILLLKIYDDHIVLTSSFRDEPDGAEVGATPHAVLTRSLQLADRT